MLEGIEVVFIVIAIGASGRLILPAAAGALAALAAVALLGLWLHRPLARVPENALKFGVGVLLAAFGTFWVGEGIGLVWPGGDAMLAILIAACFGTAYLLVGLCRSRHARRRTVAVTPPVPDSVPAAETPMSVPTHPIQLVLTELLALFVDDGALALGIMLWTALNWAIPTRIAQFPGLHAALYAAGMLALLAQSAWRAAGVARNPGPAA